MTLKTFGCTLSTALALAALSVGCTPSAGSAPGGETAPPTTPPPAANTNPEQGMESVGPPLVLELRGPDPAPSGGTLSLVADFAAPGALKVPVTVTVTLPKGATLSSGSASEVIPSLPAGHTTRTFTINLSGPLSEPVVVVAEGKSGNAFGFHAEQKYPAPTPTRATTPMMPGAPPPGSRVPTNVPMTKPAK